jgi:hypothetical protein
MKNLDKMILGAATVAAAAGAVEAGTPAKTDSVKNEKAEAVQVDKMRRGANDSMKDEGNGLFSMMINGQKQFFAKKNDEVGKDADPHQIASQGEVKLSAEERPDASTQVAGTDADKIPEK